MQAFEYLDGLFTLIIGLAVVDIAISLHRLMRIRTTLRWDPLVLLAAAYVLLLAITMWFKLWSVRSFTAIGDYLFALWMCVEFLLLFLMAAASLPDEPEPGIDLRRFYAENRRYLWGLVLLYQISNAAHWVYFFLNGEPFVLGHVLMSFALPVAISAALLVLRSRAAHYAGVAVLLVMLFADRMTNVIH